MTDDNNTDDNNIDGKNSQPRVERSSSQGDRRGNDRFVSELKPRRQKGDRRKS